MKTKAADSKDPISLLFSRMIERGYTYSLPFVTCYHELLIILFHPSISPSRSLRIDTPGKNEHKIIWKQESQGKKKFSKRFPSIEFSSGWSYRSGKLPRQFTNMHILDCPLLLLLFITAYNPRVKRKKTTIPTIIDWNWAKGKVDFKISLIFRLII